MRIQICRSVRSHEAVLRLAGSLCASLHSSPAREKATMGSDLAKEISDNILAAGIRYLKGDREKLADNIRKRKAEPVVDNMLKTHAMLKLCISEINRCRRDRNILTREIATAKESMQEESSRDMNRDAVTGVAAIAEEDSHLEEGRQESINVKQYLKTVQEKLEETKLDLLAQVSHIPNSTHPDVPEGGYEASRVVHVHGSKPEFCFLIEDHLTIGEKHGLIDFNIPAMVSGRNFYYLKGAAALLELALIQFAMQKALTKGYHPIMTPDIVKTTLVRGCGFNPRAHNNQVYNLVGNQNKLCLSGTAEIPLAGMLFGELMALKKLPMRYVAFGRCFRRESGGYGLGPRGLYRVHQFSKVELFAVTANETGKESEEMLQEMVAMQREMLEELGLHYRVLEMSTEELGTPAYHKYDVEVWMPGRDSFGEVCSASNCTDFQSMRLKTVYHNPAFNKDRTQPKKKFVHTVNATAIAVPRMILALLENCQQKDGSVLLPEALRPFLPPDCWHIQTDTTDRAKQ